MYSRRGVGYLRYLFVNVPAFRLCAPTEIIGARFVDRPNQFLVRCRREDDGRLIRAFMPNPGRMWELLLPGALLSIQHQPRQGSGRRATRKTSYTVLAVERDGAPIVLHTQHANALARHLIDNGGIPALKNARVLRSEVTVGRSRFDFLLRNQDVDVMLEVKSTTLFGNGIAMFPDAVTERGRKHLTQLMALRQSGMDAAVLFVVHAPDARWFMPDFHTDLAFSQTLIAAHDCGVRILPAAIEWNRDLSLTKPIRMLEISWPYVRREAGEDRGGYLLIMRLQRTRRLSIGALGTSLFPRGYYLYVGSALANLSSRLARHRRLRKRCHWHVDYLRAAASEVITLPVRSSTCIECDLARALEPISTSPCSGFGSSDCACPTHLFTMPINPLHDTRFHRVLQRFRMCHPDSSGPE